MELGGMNLQASITANQQQNAQHRWEPNSRKRENQAAGARGFPTTVATTTVCPWWPPRSVVPTTACPWWSLPRLALFSHSATFWCFPLNRGSYLGSSVLHHFGPLLTFLFNIQGLKYNLLITCFELVKSKSVKTLKQAKTCIIKEIGV